MQVLYKHVFFMGGRGGLAKIAYFDNVVKRGGVFKQNALIL